MSILRPVNSKANIKQTSNTDMPANVSQNILNRYEADSTLAQTVINMSFSVDQANKDAFLLHVDGKLLREGAANDYTFTNIASDNTSSQVTLNAALPAGLNIIAIKAGTKIEAELQTDTRFTAAYDNLDKALQGFISQDVKLVATTTTGTPATGTFYSSIPNRSSMVDITADLKARMGVERIPIQGITLSTDEFGPNSEIVWKTANDTFNQIRFVGQWSSAADTDGNYIKTSTVNDYVEITFYGTGLNLLFDADDSSIDVRSSNNGGSESGATIMAAAYSTILGARNYAANQILNVYSNLTLGVYTVKLRQNSTVELKLQGVEVLNESSSIKTNGGIAYIQGKKITPAAASVAYNTGFTNVYGTAGSRGGRVLQYLDQSGNIKKDIRYVNTSSALLSSADHTNEDIIRSYLPKEFGAGRSDDLTTATGTATSRAFTLEDGVTSISGTGIATAVSTSGIDGMCLSAANGAFGVFTFVGTGLDLVLFDTGSGGADTYTYQIDGATAVAWPTSTGSAAVRTQKIVSGLPYGTHTFRINRTTAVTYVPAIVKFVVYQPKKPTLPTGCIELADYNIMADYAAPAAATLGTVATGVVRKMATRENTYSGTWTGPTLDPTLMESGFDIGIATAGSTNYVEYTFFGTGVNIGGYVAAGVANATILIDGVALNTGSNTGSTVGTLLQTGSGLTLSPAGVFGGTAVAGHFRAPITGLALGKHIIRITQNTTILFYIDSFDIVTPIQSAKSNMYIYPNSTLPVGSNAISDNRKFSAIKEITTQVTNKINFKYQISTAVSASTTAPWNAAAKIYDSNNAVTTGSAWRFTCPVGGAGMYDIKFVTQTGTTAAGHYLYKNGISNSFLMFANTSHAGAQASTLVALQEGEYIDIRPDSAVTFAGSVAVTYGAISGYWVSPL